MEMDSLARRAIVMNRVILYESGSENKLLKSDDKMKTELYQKVSV